MNETEEIKETAEVTEEISTETEATGTETAVQSANEEKKDGNTEEKKPYTTKTFINDVCDIAETLFIFLLVFYLAKAFIFDQAIVDGTSMVPTLEDGQKLIYSKIYTPEDNDIVIVDTSDEHGENLGLIVKRVVATGGQVVDIRDGVVYVDGEQLDEQVYEEGSTLTASHYVNTLTPPRDVHQYPVTVPEGYVFVMGDNRGISEDSRGARVGFVPDEKVIGKVVLRYSPFKEFKIFNY
ncbi:signal peptidase I [Ruminococcus sp. HUN007]|uniref:signal peptidase I n=1 Tax=Ruminococcus sp. HUN007 TaxID=1514668 RepID=UPI000678CBB8|nr:signal peptidase I [Ruminococcus sp. HUN007]